MRIAHPIPPLYDEDSTVLILGSFPSVKSREQGFFYGHPQNRFWKVLSAVFKDPLPGTVEEKKAFLLKNRVALYDVIDSCEITGSSDASIRNVVPADLLPILKTAKISRIYCNGGKAFELYRKYQLPVTGTDAFRLPSTSPANAALSLEQLVSIWSVIRES